MNFEFYFMDNFDMGPLNYITKCELSIQVVEAAKITTIHLAEEKLKCIELCKNNPQPQPQPRIL